MGRRPDLAKLGLDSNRKCNRRCIRTVSPQAPVYGEIDKGKPSAVYRERQADWFAYVRFGLSMNISQCNRHVRFTPKADIRQRVNIVQ